jgi:predicted O-methyltransferase YrrM
MVSQATVDISKALSICGWMSKRELLWLANMARKYAWIVEFGSFHGRSTRALADNLIPYGKIWAVDTWNGDYYVDTTNDRLILVNTYVLPVFKRNLRDHIDSTRVIVSRGWSHSFVPPFPVDMVFIDGDHRLEAVEKDINQALKITRPYGIVSGHDYGHPMWPGVKEKVDSLLGPVQVEETIWWKQKS